MKTDFTKFFSKLVAHPNVVTMVGRTIIFAMLIGLVIKRNQTSFPRDVIELKSDLTTTKNGTFQISKYFVK